MAPTLYIVDSTTQCCKRKIGEYGRSFAICRNRWMQKKACRRI